MFLSQQWTLHKQPLLDGPTLLQQTKLSKTFKQQQKPLVFHLADHQATRLMVFYPQCAATFAQFSMFGKMNQTLYRFSKQQKGENTDSFICSRPFSPQVSVGHQPKCSITPRFRDSQAEEGVSKGAQCYCLQQHHYREASVWYSVGYWADDSDLFSTTFWVGATPTAACHLNVDK